MKRVVISAHAGGLGDHLIYTTLPQRYAEAGYDVFISRTTGNGEPFTRNPEIAQLLWERNPFVTGIVDEAPDAGVCKLADFIGLAKRMGNPVSAIEKLHGFGEPYGTAPSVHYMPKLLIEWTNKVVADGRSISQPIPPPIFDAHVSHLARWHEFTAGDVVALESQHSGGNGQGFLANNPRHHLRDIFEYVDIMFSARHFIVGESGGQVLAAAIAPRHTFALFTTRAFNDKIFVFPDVSYGVTGQITPDYLPYP